MNAKPLLLVAVFFGTVCITQSFAQIGIKAGVNIASISQSEREDNYKDYEKKSIVGFQAGLTFDLGISDIFTIQPEVLYIQKGGKSTFKADDNNKFVSRFYYNYIDVPVLVKLKFYGDGNESGFYFIGGPYVGFAIDGKIKTETTLVGITTESDDDLNFDDEDNQKRLDYGVAFGGGIKVNRLLIDLRYNLGFNNLLDNDADNQNDNKPYLRNRGIGLTVGVEF